MLSIVEGYPRLFGRYALLTSFGRGGMGEVFLAKQRIGDTARLCVVKTLRGDLADSREYIGRFKDEAHVVVQLNHAHISQVYEYGVLGTDHFIVMEFIHGVNLRELLQDVQKEGRPLDIGLAMFAVSTTLDALAYAHRLTSPVSGAPLRVVHRDVSPANVMVGFEGDVKLIDFGLAESALKQEHTETRAVMGKVAYMSPEQARGEDVDGSADQFAAAVMLYEAVVGDRFYGDWNTHQIWQRVGHGGFVPRRWSAVPAELQPVLARALAAQPAERFADCDAFRDALDDVRAQLAPRSNKALLRDTLKRLYAARVDAERSLIARFADVLPPVDVEPPQPVSAPPGPSTLLDAPGPSTEPFLTSPSRPAGFMSGPARAVGAALVPPPHAPPTPVQPLAVASMVPELSVQTRGGPGGGTAPAGDLADLRRVNVELNEGFTDPRRPLAASVPVDATTSTVVAPANSAARGLVAALGLVVAGGIGLVVIGRSGGDRGVVADAGAVVVADAGAVVVDAGAVVVADAGAVVVDAGAVDAGTGSTSATRPVTTPPPTTTTPRAPPPTSTAPTTATPTPSAPPPAPPVSSPTTTTPVPTPESKAEPPPVPNGQRRAQLPTPALVAEALACPGVPAAMKALLTSANGEEASRRTIALKQLAVHCP